MLDGPSWSERVSVHSVAGAYFLVKPGPMLPTGFLTASACLADTAPDSWAIEWVKTKPGEREENAARLGIRAADLEAVVRWATDHLAGGGFAWPNVFSDLGSARAFRTRFLPSDIHLLGIALPVEFVDAFLLLAAPPPQRPGFAPVGTTGVYEVLSARAPLAAGGMRRGYEVLGYDTAGQFDSFRCNDLQQDFERLYGARFNEWGLFDDEAVARECAAYASRPEVGACSSTWHPWLVEEYPS